MTIITNNPNETMILAQKISTYAFNNMIILLKGDLASGKTTFTKGFGLGLNINEMINSPTFTIINQYKGDYTLYHMDLYRLQEKVNIDIFDYLNDNQICIIEWCQPLLNILKEYLLIEFKYIDENTRELTFSYQGLQYEKIIKELI